MYKNKNIIAIGNFLFKHRNYMFPLIILLIFIAIPPQETLFGSAALEDQKDWLAIFFGMLGLGIRAAVIGFAYIKRGGLNKKVYADNLVTSGIFAICRNPLYVGNVVIYFAIFLMHGSFLVLFFGTSLFILIYVSLIAAEENFLRSKFGAEFDEYCAKTPRWIPALGNLRSAISGMEFDFKKVILKDYTTIFNTLAICLGIEFYEEIALEKDYYSSMLIAAVIFVMALALHFVKSYKKHQADRR